MIIQAGCDFNASRADGCTPLMCAINFGMTSTAKVCDWLFGAISADCRLKPFSAFVRERLSAGKNRFGWENNRSLDGDV